MKKLEYMFTDEQQFDYYKFLPSYHELFWKNIFPYGNSFIQFVRFSMELLIHKYVIYYMFSGDNIVGMCVVHSCGKGRYRFLNKDDIMVGPYMIFPEYRERGYSEVLLQKVLFRILPQNKNVYDYISKENIPSIRASEGVGMKPIQGLNINNILHTISIADMNSSEFVLYGLLRRL